MAQEDPSFRQYYEIIGMNVQKGEEYLIKFKGDPVSYIGIPGLRLDILSADDDIFFLEVVEPKDRKGLYKRYIKDIERMQKVSPSPGM